MSVYAVADLHGRYDLFQMIKDFIGLNDKVYVLGDCGDRGKNGWAIIKEVYQDPRFIYIVGNHELMLVDAMKGAKTLCFYNGGKPTYEAWKYKDKPKQDMSWVHKLSTLPREQIYINKSGQRIVLCHAGYTPHIGYKPSDDDYVWNREHFYEKWDMDFVDTYMIHGHTPIPYLVEDYFGVDLRSVDPGAIWYCPDENHIEHKCDIDCGAVFTGSTVLLNLDTFEEQIFMAEDCIYDY